MGYVHANNSLLLDICTLYRDKRTVIIWYKENSFLGNAVISKDDNR